MILMKFTFQCHFTKCNKFTFIHILISTWIPFTYSY
ncbi:unnamed protein product [Schistosoma curassoni]|uniref:Uncharacterized protein n=1 Tax=Schistosoma curassoni TaxID=6186 RepID=A0A183K910_9TREM|nr:unnamed protein product [Schistosoma curassoni]